MSTCICNQSMQTGVLQSKMTTAKVSNVQQYGFRTDDRTTLFALMEFVEEMITVIENKQYAKGVFLRSQKKPLMLLTMTYY